MDLLVAFPRRVGDEWRDRLWRYVFLQWAGWPTREGHHYDGPFNRSKAVNEAAQGPWDVLVVADADTLPDFDRVRQAVLIASQTGRLVCPQDVFRSLDRAGTEAVLDGADVTTASTRWDYPNPKSSCIVVPRVLWDEVGGFDERFSGWGFEDASFYHACQAVAGIERLEGPCWHLWHPRSPEKDPRLSHYQANAELGARYKAARHDAEATRLILEERAAVA